MHCSVFFMSRPVCITYSCQSCNLAPKIYHIGLMCDLMSFVADGHLAGSSKAANLVMQAFIKWQVGVIPSNLIVTDGLWLRLGT